MTSRVTNCHVMSVTYENSGILSTNNRPTYSVIVVPNITLSPLQSAGGQSQSTTVQIMKEE
jgi:hypothetical protein